jgi:uncharacterized membrane protein YozB (DUF420 family)
MSIFPTLNASLNFTTALLLVLGYALIRRRLIKAHVVCMLTACVTSALFLASYLYYHYHHGSTRFSGHGPVRALYFTILISHTILAVVIVPLIASTLFQAFRKNFLKHAAMARITLPLWLYVSVTGVIVYWMLYRMNFS